MELEFKQFMSRKKEKSKEITDETMFVLVLGTRKWEFLPNLDKNAAYKIVIPMLEEIIKELKK